MWTHTDDQTFIPNILYLKWSYMFLKDLKRKNHGKELTQLQVWDKAHTRVGSTPENPVYTTPTAMQIVVINKYFLFVHCTCRSY